MNAHTITPEGIVAPVGSQLLEYDKSLTLGAPSLVTTWSHSLENFATIFFANAPELSYLFAATGLSIVTHPAPTRTVLEKATTLGWDKEKIVKTLLYRDKVTGELCAIVTPEFGEVDLRATKPILSAKNSGEFSPKKRLRMVSAESLPFRMETGTCGPFLPSGQHEVSELFFDSAVIEQNEQQPETRYDFGLTLGIKDVSDHQLSGQLNYAVAFALVKHQFPSIVHAVPFSYS